MTRRRPRAAPRPPMSDAQHEATSCELVRLTIGGRPPRPELEAHDDLVDDPTLASDQANWRARNARAIPLDRMRRRRV